MTKRSRKLAANGNSNVGCMWGLMTMLNFRHARGSQKLLLDARHGSKMCAPVNNHPRDEHKLKNSSKEKHEKSHCAGERESGAGYSNSSTSVKMLMENEMASVQQQKQISCGGLRNHHSDHCDVQIPGSASVYSSDLRVSNNLVSGQPSTVESFSKSLNHGAPLQDIFNKYRGQNTSGIYKNIDVSENQILFQKALNEVLEPFYRFFETSHNGTLQSEEFLEALEILGTDKDMFLKALQDPNSILVKHIEDRLNSHSGKGHTPLPCKSLEEKTKKCNGLEQQPGKATASYKMFHRQNLKNIFGKMSHKSWGEKNSDDTHSSQPLKRIVLLKPVRAKQEISTNAIGPGSSPKSPHNKIANMKNEGTVFGFTLQEIKKRLRHTKGERKRAQRAKFIDGVPHRLPSIQDPLSKEQISQSETIYGRSERTACKSLGQSNFQKEAKKHLLEMLGTEPSGEHLPATYPSRSLEKFLSVTDDNVPSPRCSPGRCTSRLGQSDFQQEAKKHLLEMLGTEPSGEHLPATYPSRPLEKFLSVTDDNVPSPRCSPGRCTSRLGQSDFQQEAKKHLLEMLGTGASGEHLPATYPSRPLEKILSLPDDNMPSPRCSPGRCTSEEPDSGVHVEEQTGEDSPVVESCPSPTGSLERDEELLMSSLHESLTQGVDNSTLAYVADNSPCASNSSGNENKEMEEHSFITKALSAKVGVVDTESMKGQNSTEIDGKIQVDATEECENDGSALSQRLESSNQKATLATASVPPGVLNVQSSQSSASIVEKPEGPSPISVLEPPFSVDTTSPGRTTELGELPISPRELHFDFEEHESLDVAMTPTMTKQRTCMDKEEFKHKYITALLEISELSRYKTWQRVQLPQQQLLDPLLFDVVMTAGETPDDLRLLFDCINEVLGKIHDKYFTCTCSIHPFPSKENLIMEVLKGTRCHFAPEVPRTLHDILWKDIEGCPWMHLRPGSEDIEANIGDEIFDEMIEETVLELWN